MTAIAEHAQASIGTLYDYFPDKQAIAQALAAHYAEEADEYWKQLLKAPLKLKKGAIADFFVQEALAFAQARPAYLELFGAHFVHPRSPIARQPLRRTFADALRRLHPKMTAEQAFVSSQIVVELIKGLLNVRKQVEPRNRGAVTAEFTGLMRFYLSRMSTDCDAAEQ